MSTNTAPTGAPELREQVREHYAAEALKVLKPDSTAGCCGSSTKAAGCCGGPAEEVAIGFGSQLYPADERGDLPDSAVLASLGCGNPVMVAELREGETVLDLGSGGGIDVLLSARRVGPTGKAYGLDMTDEMLELARGNAEKAGVSNVEFVKGHIEDIPLPDSSIDVVISNCVVNLSPDKPAVLASTYRVLKPGGRIGICDVVADNALSVAQRAELGDWSGCIAGALSFAEYEQALADAGFVDVEITVNGEVSPTTPGLYPAIVKARKPARPASP